MSKYPLNIPQLLKRLVPSAKYKLKGRKYEDIVWLDLKKKKPSIKDLEEEFEKLLIEEALRDTGSLPKKPGKLKRILQAILGR